MIHRDRSEQKERITGGTRHLELGVVSTYAAGSLTTTRCLDTIFLIGGGHHRLVSVCRTLKRAWRYSSSSPSLSRVVPCLSTTLKPSFDYLRYSLHFLPPSPPASPSAFSVRSALLPQSERCFCCCWRAYFNPSSSSFAPYSTSHVTHNLISLTPTLPYCGETLASPTPESPAQNMHNTYDDEFPLLRLAGLYAADIRGDGMPAPSLPILFTEVCSFGTC